MQRDKIKKSASSNLFLSIFLPQDIPVGADTPLDSMFDRMLIQSKEEELRKAKQLKHSQKSEESIPR